MKSILFGIMRTWSSLFNCSYHTNQKLFLNFLFHLWNLHQILSIFEKKMILIANVFLKLKTVIELVNALSWKCRFRTSFDSQQVNGWQTLVKSAWEYFDLFFYDSERKWSGKHLPYWNLKYLGYLVTHRLLMTSILIGIVRICSSLIKCNYLNYLPNLLYNLWNLHRILNIFKKKMIVIANLFPKVQTVKNLVKALSWKRGFRTSFDSRHVDGCQTLVISAWEHFSHIFWSLWGEMVCKISPLLKFETLWVFVNTLTADDKCPVWDCENLQFRIQMQLYQKEKTFYQLFVSFTKRRWL